MAQSRRSIFRNSALKQYVQKQERDVLPHLVSPPVFVFFWVLLGLLMSTGLLAWWGEVPVYVAGSGVILEQGSPFAARARGAVALVFLPARSAAGVRIACSVRVQVGQAGPHLAGQIERVEPGTVSPDEARVRYRLTNTLPLVLQEPSVVVTVRLGPEVSPRIYAGSVVSAWVQVSSRHILSLVTGI